MSPMRRRATASTSTAPKAFRSPPRPSPISAATTSIITRRWTPISRPRCGCSRSCCRGAGRRSIWTDDPKSEEVIERADPARASSVMTVGRKGETIRLVDQSPTPLGQTIGARACRQGAIKLSPAADRRLPGGQRADRRRPGAGDGRRLGRDLLGDAARVAGARAAGARGDQPRRRSRLYRLCPHAGRARSGDRRASAACRGGGR